MLQKTNKKSLFKRLLKYCNTDAGVKFMISASITTNFRHGWRYFRTFLGKLCQNEYSFSKDNKKEVL